MIDKVLDELMIERNLYSCDAVNLITVDEYLSTYSEGYAEGLQYAIDCIYKYYNE